MEFSLGLDVSSAVIGVCVLDSDKNLCLLDHIDLKKYKDFWSKIDFSKTCLSKICNQYKITNVYIEAPLEIFHAGGSSASTICTLQRFNATISYIVRELTGFNPVHISSHDARKTCGIKVQRTSKVGISGKEQVFNFLMETDFKDMNVERTKNGKIKPYQMDRADAYVVAKAGILIKKC